MELFLLRQALSALRQVTMAGATVSVTHVTTEAEAQPTNATVVEA